MLDDLISQVDSSRASRNARDTFLSIKSSVADRFGPSCANTAIDGAQYFSKLAIKAYPDSLAAQVFMRLIYFSLAIAGAALDFSSGETALRPNAERLVNLSNAIRFGEDVKGTEDKLRWAEAAIRDFAPNGAGIADVVRSRFNEALQSVPAESLAEVVVKMANSDRLFRAARDLEHAAYSRDLSTFDELSVDAKSFLGAVLDFMSIDRVVFAKCWNPVRQSPPAGAVAMDDAPTEGATTGLGDSKIQAEANHADNKLL
jgi:hypothetical protein